ncbi:helix-turn-helix transcriptional regulator [bacterium BMS3Abin03]|jgi:ribosome-binding protein aMBF1 (putative translation factor)|nr:helix-turn-helix transcriptional regulator [bacterium BMS3Abin03]MCG6961540.1 helix-turn-helix transcriptional regulator [bacterium BMS3Abin03]
MNDLTKLEKKLRARIKNFDEKYAAAKTRLQLAIQIAEEREKAGITQKEFAQRLHTTQSVISRIESGKQNISLDMLQKIADALGKSNVVISFR